MPGRRTAIVLPVALPPPLERMRRARVPVARLGVPAHLTLLFPFAEPAALTSKARERVVAALARPGALELRFAEARTWPGVAWLAPEPAAPVSALIERLAAAFPEHPPYGGVHAEIVPHVTLAEPADGEAAAGAEAEAVAAAARAWLPFTRRIDHAVLLEEGADGRWRRRWRLRLDG